MWNVPQIIQITDSNGFTLNNLKDKGLNTYMTKHVFHAGDTYSIEVTIDPSFSETDYVIKWEPRNRNSHPENNKFNITFTNSDVAENFT